MATDRKTSPTKAGSGAETRRSTRKPIRTLGEIVPEGREHGMGCTVLDMSASGAKLKVEGAVRKAFAPVVAIPETFRLLIARDGIAIDCRLAWRDNDTIGVAFTSAFLPIRATKRA